MTGALNKATFEVSFQAAHEAARADKVPLLLALADFDDFNAFNDRYGRAAGDRVLREFALQSRRTLGRDALFGRTGDDEFVFLAHVSSTNEGERFAIGLHSNLSLILTKQAQAVTCSMGALLILPHDRRSTDALLQRVQDLMAVAKHSGKNAVEIDHADLNIQRLTRRFPSVPARQWR